MPSMLFIVVEFEMLLVTIVQAKNCGHNEDNPARLIELNRKE